MVSEIFKDELSLIENVEIRNFVVRCLETLKQDEQFNFFKAPASSSGRYHPEFALGDGGLVRHTKAVVMFANELSNLTMFNCGDYDNPFNKDSVIAACILHDTCKQPDFINHESVAADHIADIYNSEFHDKFDVFTFEKIWCAVRCHMGQWGTSCSDNSLTFKETQVVILSDYIASRRFIDIKDLKKLK